MSDDDDETVMLASATTVFSRRKRKRRHSVCVVLSPTDLSTTCLLRPFVRYVEFDTRRVSGLYACALDIAEGENRIRDLLIASPSLQTLHY